MSDEKAPQPPDATVRPCPECGYRRLVVHMPDGHAIVRTHDLRAPSRSVVLTGKRLGRCPGSGARVDAWVPA